MQPAARHAKPARNTFIGSLDADRRLCVLRVLADAPGGTAPASVLLRELPAHGHVTSTVVVLGDLATLNELRLVHVDDGAPSWVAKLTPLGREVAEGLARAFLSCGEDDADTDAAWLRHEVPARVRDAAIADFRRQLRHRLEDQEAPAAERETLLQLSARLGLRLAAVSDAAEAAVAALRSARRSTAPR